MNVRRRVAIAACFVLIAAGVRPVQADPAKAAAYFEKGTRLYQVGEYTQAIEQFKAGHIEEPDPSFLFNIAQCQRQLGQSKEALISYKRFLALDPDTAMRPDVERKIASLEEKLRKDAAAAPPVVAAVPPVVTAPPPSPGAAVYVQPAVSKQPAAPPRSESESAAPERSRWPVWLGGALTLAFAGGAVALGLNSNARFDHFKETCGLEMKCQQSVRDEIALRELLINGLIGLAGASAIATGIALFVGPKERGVAVSFAF